MRKIKEFELAEKVLDNSGVIAFPTETVMGLGIYFDDFQAYNYLNEIKRRPEDKPYTLMLSDINQIDAYAFISIRDKKIIDTFMPGSITILLNVKDSVPVYVHHDTGVIGIRIPDVKETLELLSFLERPLLVPSANRSGYIFKGQSIGGTPSTIVDLTGEEVKILREGPISKAQIEQVLKGEN